jgi:hypothetical protein
MRHQQSFASCFKCFATGGAIAMLLTANVFYGTIASKQKTIDDLTQQLESCQQQKAFVFNGGTHDYTP